MMAVVLMFTTDGRTRLTSSTNEVGATGMGVIGATVTCTGFCGATGCAGASLAPWQPSTTASANRTSGRLFRGDILHTQIIEEVVEQLALFLGQVAAGLFAQHGQDVERLLGERQVLLRSVVLGVLDLAQVHQHRRAERHDEGAEIEGFVLLRLVTHGLVLGISTVSTPALNVTRRCAASAPRGNAIWQRNSPHARSSR